MPSVIDQDFVSSPAIVTPPTGPAIYSISGAVLDDAVAGIPVHLFGGTVGYTPQPPEPPLQPYIVRGQFVPQITVPNGIPDAGGNLVLLLGRTASFAAMSGSDGVFQFSGVPNGAYIATATSSGQNVGSISPSSVITVANGDVDLGTFAVSLSTAINGTIRGVGGVGTLPGTVVDFVGRRSGSVVAAANGAYSISQIPRGIYVVTPQSGTFTPSSRTVNVYGSNSGQDFSAV